MKKKASKKTAIFCVLLALILVAGGMGGYFYWRSLPSQQFEFFPPPRPAEEPDSGGLILTIVDIGRNRDGSGFVEYEMENPLDGDDPSSDVMYYGDDGPWIDYYYQGDFYQVYPRADQDFELAPFPSNPVEPGKGIVLTELLSEKTLAVPGRYRLRVDQVGCVEFRVTGDGKIEKNE
ncbi:unknown [Clostridium sp. CAG:1013]|nr:unknown [Clostridium sp. CAG:1013]